MFTAIIRKLYIWSKQWFEHPGWHLKLSFNNFIFFVDFFAVFVLFCSFFFIEIKKGCPQTIAGLSSVDILALVLRVSLGLVIMVTLESSGPIDYIASLFVHKSCIFPFHNQVSDEAIDSITAGILMSLISYKRRVLLREIIIVSDSLHVHSLKWRANPQNVNFQISLLWPIHIINPVDKTKLSFNTPHSRITTVSLETSPLYQRHPLSSVDRYPTLIPFINPGSTLHQHLSWQSISFCRLVQKLSWLLTDCSCANQVSTECWPCIDQDANQVLIEMLIEGIDQEWPFSH